MFGLYRTLTSLGGPLISWHLARRAGRGKEDPLRKAERKGISDKLRPDGKLVWFHAASVGESASVMPLIERLQEDMPDLNILLTTGTVTSARLCEDRLTGKAFHQYVPVDRGAWVGRFLDHWKPDLALWVESEFWPNLLYQLKSRNIPTVLVNARMSVKSYARWMKAAKTARNLLGCFDLCLAPDHVMADRLRDFGVNRVTLTGNLKDASPPLPVDENELVILAKAIGSRPVWIAASTHPGEEGLAEHVHEHLTPDFPNGFPEQIPMEFHSPYGCSKGAADQYMLDYARMFGLRTIVFRHSSMYGARQFATFDQGWVGWFCRQALEAKAGRLSEPFTIAGNGKQVRDLLHAHDLVRLYRLAIVKADAGTGHAFNIGGGMENSLSLLELFALLEELEEVTLDFRRLEPRESDQKVFVADNTKVRQIFGWEPLTSARTGISSMLDWSKDISA